MHQMHYRPNMSSNSSFITDQIYHLIHPSSPTKCHTLQPTTLKLDTAHGKFLLGHRIYIRILSSVLCLTHTPTHARAHICCSSVHIAHYTQQQRPPTTHNQLSHNPVCLLIALGLAVADTCYILVIISLWRP